MDKNNTKLFFDSWIESKNSNNTISSYTRVVPNFFECMTGKELENLTAEDLREITPMSVREKYIMIMKEEGKTNGTIKNYLAVVSSFVKYLSANRAFDVNFEYITSIALDSSSLRDDSKRRELMTESDYENFKFWLLNKEFAKRYGNLGERYALALEMMYNTAIRIDAIFNNLKWSGMNKVKDSMGNEVWTLEVEDKGGKVNEKSIHESFANRIIEVFWEDDLNDDDLILKSISKQSFTRLMKEFSDEFGVKITPHSIKVGAGTIMYSTTNDIYLTSRFLDHSSIKTTERYIRTDDDKTNTGSYIMTTEIEENQINELSHEQLLKILNQRKDLKRSILLQASKNGMI